MPKYKNIPVSQVLQTAKMELGLFNNNSFDYAISFWIAQGALHLDNMETIKPFGVKLFFEDGVAELPCNYISFGALKGGISEPDSDDGSNPISTSGNTPYMISNVEYTNICGVNNDPRFTNPFGQVQIMENCINAGIDGYANLIYQGYNLDENGIPVIIFLAERALAAFAAWKIARQKPDMYPNYRDWKDEWIAQKSWLKGLLWQQYVTENKQRIKQWQKTLLPDQQNYNI